MVVADSDDRVGRVLAGTWRVDRRLGSGGMATVYAGHHVRNHLPVAIKVLHVTFHGDAAQRQRFAREGYVANRIGHPGVVRVIDDGVDGEDPYLVMELLEGCTLKDEWQHQGRRLALSRVSAVLEPVLEMLAAAHAAGIIHRDVKPDNVFVTKEGAIRLMDFGVARLREGPDAPRTDTGDLLGTPAFMSPEQAAGRWSEVGVESDVYAVGATAWVLLSGRLIHETSSIGTLLVAMATSPASPIRTILPELPAAHARVIDRALAFDRAERWPTAHAMLEAWRAAAKATGVGATERMGRPDELRPQITERMDRPDLEPVFPTQPMARAWSLQLWVVLTIVLTLLGVVGAWILWSALTGLQPQQPRETPARVAALPGLPDAGLARRA